MIKIFNGSTGWWFDGHRFSDTRDMATPVSDVDGLRRAIVRRAFYLNRWQGECGPYGPVSVGVHSLIVADFAYHIAIARDLSEEAARLARRFGAIHDLGETLGMGDIAAPWLRSGKIDDAAIACDNHQEAAESLFPRFRSDLDPAMFFSAKKIVKDADRAAAAFERRCFFSDSSGDCEAPGARETMNEIASQWRRGFVYPASTVVGRDETDRLLREAMGHA